MSTAELEMPGTDVLETPLKLPVVWIKRYLEDTVKVQLLARMEAHRTQGWSDTAMNAMKREYIELKLRYARLYARVLKFLETHSLFTLAEFEEAFPMEDWEQVDRDEVKAGIADYIKESEALTDVLQHKELVCNPPAIFKAIAGSEPVGKVNVRRHGPMLILEVKSKKDYVAIYVSKSSDEKSVIKKARSSGGFFRSEAPMEVEQGEHAVKLIVVQDEEYAYVHEQQHALYHYGFKSKPDELSVQTKQDVQNLVIATCNGCIKQFQDEIMAKVKDGNGDFSADSLLNPEGMYFFAPQDVSGSALIPPDDLVSHWNIKDMWKQRALEPYKHTTSVMRKIGMQMEDMHEEVRWLFEIEPAQTWFRLYRWLLDTGYLDPNVFLSPETVLKDAKSVLRQFEENGETNGITELIKQILNGAVARLGKSKLKTRAS